MQQERTYKFHIDRPTAITTAIYIVVIICVSVLLWHLYVGGFFSAWFISVVAALVTLMTLSIPRRLVVDQEKLTMVCVVEIVEIPLEDIVSVRAVNRSESRWIVPLFASRGFFGYYGYYLDLSNLNKVRFYASEWQNLVEIIDIYDECYYISCRQKEELIEDITHRCELLPNNSLGSREE